MPLFRCEGCSMRIERSMEAYWRNKGKLLCSSCLDRQAMPQKTTEDGRQDGSSGFRDNGNKS
ncbi:hypothetical protein FZZ91_03880 [Synechococcus sp. HB1133]|nr:hypothetical protein [Synechococcus sp. PH41509]MCB4421978.1 hypothetical protein [Synechococcus sp. HB1133]MCB4430075.1 hypothetical protein [Synechococcus sp. HBA1120]NHI80920.1 hypothetical protein [Synechococcus sp. HB1133]